MNIDRAITFLGWFIAGLAVFIASGLLSLEPSQTHNLVLTFSLVCGVATGWRGHWELASPPLLCTALGALLAYLFGNPVTWKDFLNAEGQITGSVLFGFGLWYCVPDTWKTYWAG